MLRMLEYFIRSSKTYQESSRPVLTPNWHKFCLVIDKFFSGAWYEQ